MIAGEPKWVFSLEEGNGSITGVITGEYYIWGYCNIVVKLRL